MTIWSLVEKTLRGHDKAVLVTVVRTQGSSPREPGARMVVTAERGYSGTIGGGTLEFEAIDRAAKMLKQDGPVAEVKSYGLGPELGQCCGGRVDVLFEKFEKDYLTSVRDLSTRETEGSFVTQATITDSGVTREVVTASDGEAVDFSGGLLTERFGDTRRPLLLFGAGHVGRAMVLALAPLPFRVTWYDTRADAFPQHHPANVDAVKLSDVAEAVISGPSGAFALVMTHSHPLDQHIVTELLKDGRCSYVGLIGSATKKARFISRLRDAGVSEDALRNLVCPIGVMGITSKQPASIAASVAAQLLERDEAVRRNRNAEPAQNMGA